VRSHAIGEVDTFKLCCWALIAATSLLHR